jgi:rfaE bifunctional protein nucleotidyltransferase chain/domain
MVLPVKPQLDLIRAKIMDRDTLVRMGLFWRFKDQKIVFTNGCFDILHQGHIDYLSKAADCGNVLIVGVNSDASVKKLGKGLSRPIQDEQSRALLIASLQVVTAVVIFDEDTPYDLIKLIQPDVLVKGSDYKVEDIAGHDIVLQKGGEVKLIDFLPGYSTSAIEKKIKQS